MGWRYRRSFRIAPGLRLNAGKRGLTSVSVGGRGATLNVGKRGSTSTLSLPGTGLSYQHRFKSRAPTRSSQSPLPTTPTSVRSFSLRVSVIGAVVVVVGGYLALRTPAPSSPPAMRVASLAVPVAPAVVTMPSAGADGPQSMAFVPQAVAAPAPAVVIQTRRVKTTQANVRSAPSISGSVVRTFMRGQIVQVLQTENAWTRVAEHDGVPIGWMHNSVLE
jgi:hypothetical protein